MKIVIAVKKSGLGLFRDLEILTRILEADNKVSHVAIAESDWVKLLTPGFLRRFRRYIYSFLSLVYSFISRFKNSEYDLAIYLESYRPWYVHKGRKNILIPNQEWLSPDLRGGLKYFDSIWCKTLAAKSIFDKHHSNTQFLGFSSDIDESLLTATKDQHLILHRAGNSLLRGTRVLMNTWAKHADWPKLSVILSPKLRVEVFSGKLPENIEYLEGPWDDREFSQLMARARTHIHPTETEGYGLAISEALGYGCLVMATNAEPMNELVEPSRGVLLDCRYKSKYNLGDLYEVLPAGIEQAMVELLSMSSDDLLLRMNNARRWYLINRENFEGRVLDLVVNIKEDG